MTIFKKVELEILEKGLEIESYNFDKPWGGFFVIEEPQSQKFADVFFDKLNIESIKIAGKLSPKILVVKPGSRLSWQYHFRRLETWKILEGPVGIFRSLDDNQGELIQLETGQLISFNKEERHRLVGLKNWGVVAEFWQHTDFSNPSNEEDIIRVQDDYLRE